MVGEVMDMKIEILASPKPLTVAIGSDAWFGLMHLVPATDSAVEEHAPPASARLALATQA
jgi:hypothetical protein